MTDSAVDQAQRVLDNPLLYDEEERTLAQAVLELSEERDKLISKNLTRLNKHKQELRSRIAELERVLKIRAEENDAIRSARATDLARCTRYRAALERIVEEPHHKMFPGTASGDIALALATIARTALEENDE